jgi:hypothetical protein
MTKITKDQYFKDLVNFKNNLNLPRHNWFKIKEGYSSELVKTFIDSVGINKKEYVFDPFSGSGTTVLTSNLENVNSVGFEVNPFLHFVSKAKLINLKTFNYKNFFENANRIKIQKDDFPKLSIAEKLFQDQLEVVVKSKKYIETLNSSPKRDLFKLAYLTSLEESSFAKKDGNGLKYPRNKIPGKFETVFMSNFEMIKNDLKLEINKNLDNDIYLGNTVQMIQDSKFLNKYNKKIKLAIFSPPYVNCFDYTEVYKTELWFGSFVNDYPELKKLRESSLSSHLNKKYFSEPFSNKKLSKYLSKINSDNLWNKNIPLMINNYFFEFEIILKNIFSLMSKNGVCVIVVGNSSYDNIAIPVDEILCDIANKIGYVSAEIKVARELGTSSQQYKSVDNRELLRESLVILNK